MEEGKLMYYFTDIHGHIELFHIMRDWCYQQNPNCTIIYGGDAADRGENGYQIIKEILNDTHFIYLYGNHEDLFVKAADEIIGHYSATDGMYNKLHSAKNEQEAKQIIEDAADFNVKLHIQNNGFPTLRDWLLDGANEEIIDQLRQLPRTYSWRNIDFCHAGGTYDNFKQVYQSEYFSKPMNHNAAFDVIWNRTCLALGWETDRICIFGHTPTLSLSKSMYGSGDKSYNNAHPAAWQDRMGGKVKRGGWKIDMDTAAFWTNIGYVLDTDTMNVFKFSKSSTQALDFYKIL
jgi:hypothetical protein